MKIKFLGIIWDFSIFFGVAIYIALIFLWVIDVRMIFNGDFIKGILFLPFLFLLQLTFNNEVEKRLSNKQEEEL